ncbi:hypothetical protein [Kitasatospora sp. NPDC093806]|uniref:hypothetical protein n=1 Tax=Kitasatospora sp. NPDC093806 TaxID=3155075 RepID=UPI00341DEA99
MIDEADATPWAALFEEPGPSAPPAKAWLLGLGANRAAPADVLIGVLDTGHTDLLLRRDLPPGVVDAAVDHPARRVWGAAAEQHPLSPAQWARLLAAHAGTEVHDLLVELAEEQAARREDRPRPRIGIERPPAPDARPPATPEEIAARADAVPEIGPADRTYALWWVAELHDDPDAMRQLASSPKLWVRRSVARAPHLPPDVVGLLARDEDHAVRLFLTESCDDAPADLLLTLWANGLTGTLSFPGGPRAHPNFPRHDLLRFADDPRPRVRLLALDDPASTAELVERLARDPDPAVRTRAAEDPRLSPGTATALTADADPDVRRAARRHPHLPPTLLAALLHDADTAEEAAGNPGIPVAVLRRMVAAAAAGIGRRPE